MTKEWIAILSFIGVPSITSLIISTVIEKKTSIIEVWIRRAITYISIYYGLMSFIKWFLGERDNILYRCFFDVTIETYYHYSPILLIVEIAVVSFFYFLNKRGLVEIVVKYYTSAITTLLLLTLIAASRVSNRSYLLIMILSIVCTIWNIVRKTKLDPIINFKTRVILSSIVILFYNINIYIFIPIELFLNNTDAFRIGFMDYACTLTIMLVILTIGASATVSYICSDIMFELFITITFAMTLLGYIQSNFLNGKMMQMDGTLQTWSTVTVAVNLVIWTLGISGILILLKKKKEIAIKIIRYVAIYVSLIQLATVMYLTITCDTDLKKIVFSTRPKII